MKLRALVRADWPAVLSLNEASVHELSELDGERLQFVLTCAHRALVAEAQGAVVAFAVAMAPRAAYDSSNYRWFSERFERFLYLDRIAVDPRHRRAGIGARLYDEMEAAARPFGRMVCEVNLEPRNEASLAFHEARGYREIARLQHPGKLVALMSKELVSRSQDL
jgi:predicted GNAT superfamily acetyltransferase